MTENVKYIRIQDYVFNIYKILSVDKKFISSLVCGIPTIQLEIRYCINTTHNKYYNNMPPVCIYHIECDNEKDCDDKISTINAVLSTRQMLVL